MAYELVAKSVEVCQNLVGVLIGQSDKLAGIQDSHQVVIHEVEQLNPRDLPGFSFLRVGGLCTGLALALAHPGGQLKMKPDPEFKDQWEFANKVHLCSALGLLAVPLSNRPYVTGNLLLIGSALYCGSLYHASMKKETNYLKYAPYGGLFILAGFASFAL